MYLTQISRFPVDGKSANPFLFIFIFFIMRCFEYMLNNINFVAVL